MPLTLEFCVEVLWLGKFYVWKVWSLGRGGLQILGTKNYNHVKHPFEHPLTSLEYP